MTKDIKKKLQEWAKTYHCADFIQNDPVQFPHRYRQKQDIEISGLLTAIMSFGNRKQILKKADELHDCMGALNWLPPYITGSANTLLYTTVSINQSILNDIQSCNGRVMVLNTISYIDNAAHPAVMGWPTTSIPVPYNATEIVSRVN